jgi:threonyl-tRNA synthetase
MRLLFVHSDFIEYELQEPLSFAEKVAEHEKSKRVENSVVIFTCIEKDDELEIEKIAEEAAREITAVMKTLKAENIVIYPYAHLSSSLAAPQLAISALKKLEKKLLENFVVTRAPFGWYKSFTLKCKGHPLAELSKEIKLKEEPRREELLEKIVSQYYILTPEGKELEVKLADIENLKFLESYPKLRKFIYSEELKAPAKEPPSIKAMQRLELVGYEEASDSGHFRFYPKGHLMFNLLRKWADELANNQLKALEIATPIVYDWAEQDIREQAKSFHQRHYVVKTEDRNFVLRFAADFGLFKMLKDATISYKNLPFRVYEFSKSFRYEQHGELCGLQRLRAFHMPDIHSFTKDLEQGWEEFKCLYKSYIELATTAGIEYVNAFRIVKEYYDDWKPKLFELVKYSKEPVWVEVLSGKVHYWVAKHELQAIDSVGGNTQLCTIQLDLEDAARYGIVYTDKDGKRKGCIICHSSVGSIERWLYAFLEEALKKAKPELPFWLSPTQVRFIPVTSTLVKDCEKLAEKLPARVDIDDREEKVSRKIRDAEREWINFIIVYGEKEKKTGRLPVRVRSGEIKELSFQELQKEIKKKLESYPYEELTLPRLLSKRIVFRG